MTNSPNQRDLGILLRKQRRERRLSLRYLSDEIGVSVNTLSRVERGFVPDLKNFQRIVEWLGVPADDFLEGAPADLTPPTPAIIARHLRADSRLSDQAADQIAGLVEEMYQKLANTRPALAVHLRSAKTFTPAAGVLLAEILNEMSAVLGADENEG